MVSERSKGKQDGQTDERECENECTPRTAGTILGLGRTSPLRRSPSRCGIGLP